MTNHGLLEALQEIMGPWFDTVLYATISSIVVLTAMRIAYAVQISVPEARKGGPRRVAQLDLTDLMVLEAQDAWTRMNAHQRRTARFVMAAGAGILCFLISVLSGAIG